MLSAGQRRALHAQGQAHPGWDAPSNAPAFSALVAALHAAGHLPLPLAPPGSPDCLAALLPALQAVACAQLRLALARSGDAAAAAATVGRRLSPDAAAAWVPSGQSFAAAALAGAVAASTKPGAGPLPADAAPVRALCLDAVRAVAAAVLPPRELASGAAVARLVAAPPDAAPPHLALPGFGAAAAGGLPKPEAIAVPAVAATAAAGPGTPALASAAAAAAPPPPAPAAPEPLLYGRVRLTIDPTVTQPTSMVLTPCGPSAEGLPGALTLRRHTAAGPAPAAAAAAAGGAAPAPAGDGMAHATALSAPSTLQASAAAPTFVLSEPDVAVPPAAAHGFAPYCPLAGLPPGLAVAVEGVVERRLDAGVADPGDARYRALSRARTAAAAARTRVARTVAAFAPVAAPREGGGAARAPPRGARGARPGGDDADDDCFGGAPAAPAGFAPPAVQVPLPARRTGSSRAGRGGGGGEGGKAPRELRDKLSDDDLTALLFSLFERRSHWKVADLAAAAKQPVGVLRTTLASVAQMERGQGPLKGTFVLLPHLRRPPGAGEGGS